MTRGDIVAYPGEGAFAIRELRGAVGIVLSTWEDGGLVVLRVKWLLCSWNGLVYGTHYIHNITMLGHIDDLSDFPLDNAPSKK